MTEIKKGDRLIYTGPYATAADMAALGVTTQEIQNVRPYPPGTVVAFRNYKTKVTVLLDREEGDTEDLYADWPVDEVTSAP